MSKRVSLLLLFLIIAIASILRLYQLGNVPPSPDWDEASLGYNAYSIMLTGRDEYGKFLPVVLRSFDDYKPALYAYLIIPFIKVLGLNIVSVRLPSALFGILTVIGTYFLVKELFGKSNEIEYLALLSSFLLAISPWHIQFSRVAFESNVGLAINVFTLLFFLKGLNYPRLLPVAFLLGALNIHMYQGNRVFTPLLLITLSLIFRKELRKIFKWYTVSIVIAFFIILPFILYIFTNQNALLRAKGVSVFSDQTQFLKRSAEKLSIDRQNKDYLGLILDNRRVEYGKAIISGYVSHFDLNWLFITGDIARHHAPFMGLLYLFELPFLFIGFYQLIFGSFNTKIKLVLFSYFLLVPIPAAITTGVPHAVRTLNFVPMFHIFSAVGILTAFLLIKQAKVYNYFKFLIFIFIFSFLIFNFFYYLNQYFVQQNYYTSADWQYGYKEAVDFVAPIAKSYDKIIVSNERPLDQSYMFFLFYTAYDPKKYLKEGGTVSGGFREAHRGFANFTFRLIEWGKEKQEGKTLYIGKPSDFPSHAKVLKTIFYLNGEEAIRIVEG